MINQTRQQTKYCMGFSSGSKKGNHNHNYNYNNNYANGDDDASIEKLLKEIEANQDSALSLCTEKVLLAQQAYELVSFFSLFSYSFYDLDERVSCIQNNNERVAFSCCLNFHYATEDSWECGSMFLSCQFFAFCIWLYIYCIQGRLYNLSFKFQSSCICFR